MAMTKRLKTVFMHNRIMVTAYTVPAIPADKLRCRHKGGHSSLAQKKYNKRKSLERIVLKALNTFITGCLFVTYTYDDENLPENADIAFKDLFNTIRKTKRLYKQSGLSCPYIASVENGKQFNRVHCHALYPYTRDIDIEKIKSRWRKGKVIVYIIPETQVKNRVMYVLKAPLRQSVGKAFIVPTEEIRDIPEAEFRRIIENPLSMEYNQPGFKVSNIEEKTLTGWIGFKKVKIYLIKSTNSMDNGASEKGERIMFNSA